MIHFPSSFTLNSLLYAELSESLIGAALQEFSPESGLHNAIDNDTPEITLTHQILSEPRGERQKLGKGGGKQQMKEALGEERQGKGHPTWEKQRRLQVIHGLVAFTQIVRQTREGTGNQVPIWEPGEKCRKPTWPTPVGFSPLGRLLASV